MIKLFKNLTKIDWLIALVVVILVVFSVFLDLKMPEYMSDITILVQTDGNTMKDILIAGAHMMACAFGSLFCTIAVGFFTSLLSARFSRTIRRKLFAKVEDFGLAEIKKFHTSSLITRTTNDVTQIETLLAMGLQLVIKSPVMAIWALLKIFGKSAELSMVTAVGVVIIVVTNMLIISIVTPRFVKIQKLTDNINGVTRENITGIRVIRAFNAEKFEQKRFSSVNDAITKPI